MRYIKGDASLRSPLDLVVVVVVVVIGHIAISAISLTDRGCALPGLSVNMAAGSIGAATGCLGCEKMEAEQEELNETEETEDSSSDKNSSHELGALAVFSLFIKPLLKPKSYGIQERGTVELMDDYWVAHLGKGSTLPLYTLHYSPVFFCFGEEACRGLKVCRAISSVRPNFCHDH
ncbi:hypothetical protein F5B21DRAFT_491642, partial [Xylaria acuta]